MSINHLIIQEVLRYINVPYMKAEDELKEQITAMYHKLESNIRPKHTYKLMNVEVQDDKVQFLDTTFSIKSKDLSELLRHSGRCFILAVTLGIEADHMIHTMQKMNMSDAMVLDACGSVFVEKVCDDIESIIMKTLNKDEFLTMRYSPGYGDVPIEVQSDITEILQTAKAIGLTVSKSYMLLPTKSITAFIGISNQKENRQKSCSKCNLRESCIYRKRGDRCGT